MAPENKCVNGVKNEQRIIALEKRSSENHAEHEKMWEAIDKLKNRLPVWATVVITLMGTLLGITGTLAVLSGKLAAAAALTEWIESFFC